MSQKTNQPHPAAVYNEKRRILFSQIHQDGHTKTALRWLEGYREVLGPKGHIGLLAELRFYEAHRKDFTLSVAGDVGDATDFVGQVSGSMFRIDVTTNTSFKTLSTYEPFQREGDKYKLAAYDTRTDTFELLDINFPFCEHCQSGRIFPVALLLGENHNHRGDSSWSNDQVLVELCGHCGHQREADRLCTSFLPDFETYARNLTESEEDNPTPIDPTDPTVKLNQYAIEARRYLRHEFESELVAVGGKAYQITDPRNGNGEWRIRFQYQLPFLVEYLALDYDIDLSL